MRTVKRRDVADVIRDLQNRVDNLERRLRRPAIAGSGEDQSPLEVIFSHAGTPTTDVSPRWYPPRNCTLDMVLVSLGTAGSTNTVVTVYVNGGSQGTITLGNGVNKNTGSFADPLVADTDYVTVAATTVGTGAEDLTVQARLT